MKKNKLFTLLAALVCVTSMGAQNVAKVGDTEYISFATAVSNWTNGTTLQLLADIEYADPITVEGKTVTLDLNGHGIRHTGVEGLFCVVNGGDLTLNDSDPTTEHKFSTGENGFATLDETNGTLTINGGYLTGGIGCNNTAYLRTAEYKDGGAFFIYNGSTVTMNGGTLIGNGEAANSRTGGAVFIARNGRFILNGGTITRNRARFGGGISLYGGRTTADIANQEPSSLEIHGGEISYNYAYGNSGGVHTNGYSVTETVIIDGGSIINNIVPADAKAAGLYVEHANTTLYLSGNPVIKDNLRGTYQENIRIKTGTIHVNGTLTNTESVHVFMETVGVFTSGLSGNGNASYFASDNSGYGVKINGSGEALLAQSAGISAAPTAISELVYNGSAQALVNAGTATNGTMKYSLDNSTWSASVPAVKNAGDYTVYYMVEGDAGHADFISSPNTVAASITKAPLTITADDRTLEYGDPAWWCYQASYSGFVNGEDAAVLSGAVQFDCAYTDGGNAGTYSITPYGTTSDNYAISFVAGIITVNKVASVVTIAPAAVEGLVANGSLQTLVTAGTVTGGELQYKLNDGAWNTTLPQAAAADTYTVWYKVVGDVNHNDIAATSLVVTIAAPAQNAVNITANLDPQHADVYYSTFYDSSVRFALPAGVEAYVATISGTDLLLTKIAQSGQVIPADNAVILKSNVQNYTLTPSDETPVSFSVVNSLLGTDVAVATPDNCYVLSGHSSDNSVTGVGFYRYEGTNLNPHKAYVVFGGSSAPQRMRFIFAEEQTATGTENASADNDESQKRMENGRLVVIKNGVRYNAQGQIVK